MNPQEFLIRILLDAESKIGPVMQAAAAQAETLDRRFKGADRSAKNFDATLGRLERRMAALRGALSGASEGVARLDGAADKAARGVDALERKLARLERRLMAMEKRKIDIKVDADTGKAQVQLARLDRRARDVAGRRTISFAIDDGAALAKLKGIEGAADGVGDSDGPRRLAMSFIGLLDTATTVALAFSGQLVQSATAAAGALVAVGAAAGTAVAGLAGLATAGVAQAVPALGLIAGAWSRVTKVLDVAKLGEQAQAQAKASSQGVADNARVSALRTLATAHEGVETAQRSLLDAQEGLNRARVDGTRQLQDLVLAERAATLAAQDSQAALDRAVATGSGGSTRALQLQRDRDSLAASRQSTDTRQAVAGWRREPRFRSCGSSRGR